MHFIHLLLLSCQCSKISFCDFFPLFFLALTTISFWKVFDLLPINSLQQHYFENTKSFSKLPYSPLLSPLMVQYMYLRILIYGVNFTGFSSAYLKLHFLAAILNKVRGRYASGVAIILKLEKSRALKASLSQPQQPGSNQGFPILTKDTFVQQHITLKAELEKDFCCNVIRLYISLVEGVLLMAFDRNPSSKQTRPNTFNSDVYPKEVR